MNAEQIEYLKKLVASLAEWQLCMSYNDSYFGEPAGLVKRTSRELTKLIESFERTTAPVSLTDEQIFAIHDSTNNSDSQILSFARALLAAAPAPIQQDQSDWRIVPVEPTRDMWTAANKADDAAYAGGSQHGADIATLWEAMLSAAPVRPTQQATTIPNENNDLSNKNESEEAASVPPALAGSQVQAAGDDINYENLLSKYIDHVANEEGTTFISSLYRDVDGSYYGMGKDVKFSADEFEALRKCSEKY